MSTARRAWRNVLNVEARFAKPLRRLSALCRRAAGFGRERRHSLAGSNNLEICVQDDLEICVQSGLFDAAWYLKGDPKRGATATGALAHYLRYGARLGTDPNPLFDTDWYLQRNPEVAQAGWNPLVHYIRIGAREGRDPSPLFDSEWYLERNPDVAAAGLNPLAHYLKWGAAEGRVRRSRRAPFPDLPRSPKVSAIIPCWNGERWLAEALESITAQTYPVHEIIVVDDASTDGSGEIASRFPAIILRNDTNRGEGYSRNVGLRHASGDLIAWLDADDLWLPHHVATLVGLLQSHPSAAGAFAAVQRFGLRDELIRGLVPLGQPSHVFWQALADWLHTTIGSMTRRSALLEVGGFDETERFSVDFDLWVRLARAHLFVCTHEVTSMWRWHEAQQSAQWTKQLRALYRFRRRYLEQEVSIGDVSFAGAMQRRLLEIWRQDRRDAEAKRHHLVVQALDEVKPLISGNPADPGFGLAPWRACIVESGLFDADWYLAQHQDVAAAGIDPLDHFMASGAAEGYDPNPLFDSDWYLDKYPEVASAGHNPLVDYALRGIEAGRDPNPLFDSRWYLEQHPDVAALGINPLTHYLRWGVAKGLDPSPRFDTDWYLENNSDVVIASVNPLAHYLKWGQAEKREPVSPIPEFFEKLARRPTNTPEDFARLRRVYSSPLGIQPAKAGTDTNSVIGVAWAEQFMSNSLGLHAHGDSVGALRWAKYAAQTMPDEDDPMRLYCHLFEECNRRSMEDFAQAFSRAKLIVLHVSHKAGLEHAEASSRSFSDLNGSVANLIVVGDDLPEDTFRFDRARSILFVPAVDTYEALAQKVSKALLFIGMSPLSLPIFKVDDDATCENVGKLIKLVDNVISRHLYGGRVNARTGATSCAFWHFGKCTDEKINGRPDALLWVASYAGGQGYWLNGKAAGAMAKMSLLHERYFEVEHFEDKAVGTVLAQYGVLPYHFDVIAAGIVSDHNKPPDRGKRPVARLRGALYASDGINPS